MARYKRPGLPRRYLVCVALVSRALAKRGRDTVGVGVGEWSLQIKLSQPVANPRGFVERQNPSKGQCVSVFCLYGAKILLSYGLDGLEPDIF